jgi:hypothetical protein
LSHFGNIFIAIAPIIGQAYLEAMDSLCNEKMQIASDTDHLPRFRPPFVCILKKKVRGKTGINGFVPGQFIFPGSALKLFLPK